MKKYSRLSSAAVVTGALRVKDLIIASRVLKYISPLIYTTLHGRTGTNRMVADLDQAVVH